MPVSTGGVLHAGDAPLPVHRIHEKLDIKNQLAPFSKMSIGPLPGDSGFPIYQERVYFGREWRR